MQDNMNVMVKAVLDHAADHYEEDGWDYVVECWTPAEVAEKLEHAGAQTPEEAIDVIHCEVKIRDDYRKDIEATAF